MSDYSVKFTVRNNRLLTAIRNAGYESQAEFARENGLSAAQVNDYVAMRRPPLQAGVLTRTAQRLCEDLGVLPEDLWTEEQMYTRLKRNTSEVTMTSEDVKSIYLTKFALDQQCMPSPDESAHDDDRKKIVALELEKLTKKEQMVIKMRFGDDELSLEEVAQSLGVTRERIRQLEIKAISKLRRKDSYQNLVQLVD